MRKKRTSQCLRVAVVGEYQAGKSTLINVLLGGRRAKMGDGTRPTTGKIRGYRVSRREIYLVDTPGVNAHEHHDIAAEEELPQCDAAMFVVKSIRDLNEPQIRLAGVVERAGIPAILVVNCWKNRGWNDGDPDHAKQIIADTIERKLQIVGTKLVWSGLVNIEWAAAARGVLVDRKRAEKLILEHGGMCGDAVRILERRSRIRELERILMPSLAEALDGGALEYSVLVSKFLNCWR